MASLGPRNDLHTENDDEGSERPRNKEQCLEMSSLIQREEKCEWYCALTRMITINGYKEVDINNDLHPEQQHYQSLT